MYIQNVNSVYDINFNDQGVKYSDIFQKNEHDFSVAALDCYNRDILFNQFKNHEELMENFLDQSIPIAAYDQCTKASHILNIIDSMGFIGPTERAKYILKIREMVKNCCEMFLEETKNA
jgi:glycyl-tRNA synthetase alpha chain